MRLWDSFEYRVKPPTIPLNRTEVDRNLQFSDKYLTESGTCPKRTIAYEVPKSSYLSTYEFDRNLQFSDKYLPETRYLARTFLRHAETKTTYPIFTLFLQVLNRIWNLSEIHLSTRGIGYTEPSYALYVAILQESHGLNRQGGYK